MEHDKTYTMRLADFTSQFTLDKVPDPVKLKAKQAILDTLGIMWAGWLYFKKEGDNMLHSYIESVAGPGEATALGYNLKLPLMAAAFSNGTLVEALDWQEVTMSARMHPCSGTIPAALAVGEKIGASGNKVLEAVIAGYEVSTRVGRAMQPSHWYGGFQATGTIGTIGAAMAAGRLMGMNSQEAAGLLGIAGFILPISNGDGVFQGLSIKPIHGGMAAQTGIQAALLMKAGFRGGLLEGLPPRYHGFMNISAKNAAFEQLTDGLGDEWVMRECGFKFAPTGTVNLGPIQVTIDLVKENDLKPDQIKKVNITTYSDAYHFTGRNYTNTSSNVHDCVFSLPYSVAVAISDREMGLDQITTKRIKDPEIHKLTSKIECKVDKKMEENYPDAWPALVEIILNDGRSISRRTDEVIGSPRRPMSTEEVINKFKTITNALIGEERANKTCDLVLNIENLKDVSEMINLVSYPDQ